MTLEIETVPATFTRRKGELTKLHKDLQKLSPKMVELLAAQALNDKLDVKVRQQAMIMLIKYDIEVAKIINADNMSRMLADLKFGGKLLGGSTVEDPTESKTATVDFDNIIEIE